MRRATPLAFFLFVAVTLNAQHDRDRKITTFDVPNGFQTTPTAISPTGEIVGNYNDNATREFRAFIRKPNGTFTTFDSPDGPSPTGVNSAGQIVGFYNSNPNNGPAQIGFLRNLNGSFAEILPSGTNIYPLAINPIGEVVGRYVDEGQQVHGFIRSPNGKITVLDFPNMGYPGTAIDTVNPIGQTAGFHSDIFDPIDGEEHGFIRQPDGRSTTFDPLNSTSTFPEAINAKGQIAGFYDVSGNSHGFVRDVDGNITTVDVSGAIDTLIYGIDSAGAVAGYYREGNGTLHGFLRDADGKTTTIDAPGSTHTSVVAINPSGEIVGMFLDSEGAMHGFVMMKPEHDDGGDHGHD